MATSTTRVFADSELKQLGLPGKCEGGEVLEDRLIETVDEEYAPRGKAKKKVTNELRFVVFQLADKSIWGVAYTKHENGSVSFDKQAEGTKYAYQRVLKPIAV
jgi:hypothetical protein